MAKTKSAPTRPPEAAPPGPKTDPTPSGDRPVHEMRLGRVRCSVWQNESDTGPWYSVKVTRLYKVDAEWKASGSLNRDDLLPAAKLCEEAALWIFRQQQHASPVGEVTPTAAPGDDIPF